MKRINKRMKLIVWGVGIAIGSQTSSTRQLIAAELPSKQEFEENDKNIIHNYMISYNEIAERNKTAGMGVHEFNRVMNWKEKLPALIAIDLKYLGSKADYPFDAISAGFYVSPPYKQLPFPDQQKVQQNLNQLKGYCMTTPEETVETGAHVPQLLSRCWSLANFPEVREGNNIFSIQEYAIDFLMTVLTENTDTGGGCYPGHAGRLCQFYLLIINSSMEE